METVDTFYDSVGLNCNSYTVRFQFGSGGLMILSSSNKDLHGVEWLIR